MKKIFFLISITLCLGIGVEANNLTISNVTVTGGTPSTITFNITWNNSWNIATGPTNYDAAWVFVKYQACNTSVPPSPWNPVLLTTPVPVVSGVGNVLTATLSSDDLGVFIYPSSNGNWATLPTATVTLTMNLTDASYNYQVFGIEMVDIPTGSFYAGDGSSTNTICSTTCSGPPLQITSNAAQTVSEGCSSYALPATYPMGYNQFYMMKYEISQDQYVGFLNTLTYDQQVNRTTTPPTSPAGTQAMDGATVNRNGIVIKTPGISSGSTPAVYGNDLAGGVANINNANDGQWIACDWMNWDDLAAYLTWAGLRPMSELEFEKACRGPVLPVAGEYPWGSTALTAANSAALTGGGTTSEVPNPNTGNGLCAYNAFNTADGPLRVGYAATSLPTTRTFAGASYYGVLDLGGNVFEQTVPISFTTFRNPSVNPPSISATGYATYATTPTFWPTYAGTLTRGGEWYDGNAYLRTSDRSNINAGEGYQYFQFRNYRAGGRGVRIP